MSMAVAHFAVGATVTLLVVTYTLPRVRYPRALTMLGGIWAMVPDVHWVAPVYAAELKALHATPLANLFWFHRAMDAVDATDSRSFAAVLVALLFAATLLAERREYRALERLRELPTEMSVED